MGSLISGESMQCRGYKLSYFSRSAVQFALIAIS